MIVARAKGTNILNVKAYVVARHGPEAWPAIVATLSAEDRAEVDEILAVGWYDLALVMRVFRAFDATHGVAEPLLMEHYGAFAAELDLTQIHRLFLRMANPAYVIEKSGEYWHRFFDSGKWTVVRDTPTSATATLAGFGAVEALFCRMLTSYVRRMFELVGAKHVKTEHKRCRARGDEACVVVGSWKV